MLPQPNSKWEPKIQECAADKGSVVTFISTSVSVELERVHQYNLESLALYRLDNGHFMIKPMKLFLEKYKPLIKESSKQDKLNKALSNFAKKVRSAR